MKKLKSVFYISLLFVVTSLPHSETIAQKDSLPPELNQNSTVQEILGYLNETIFPSARIGVWSWLPGDEQVWEAETGYYTPTRLLIFSQGFKLASGADDCHIKLRNDEAKVYDANHKEVRLVELAPVTKTQPPYAVEFSTWLETVSHDKGKAPFLHTKNLEKAKLLGSWRTEFQSRGFYGRTIFGVRFPAIKSDGVNEYSMSNTVTFTFDDKLMSERFNAAFRHLINRCQPRSTKPRWKQ